MSIVKGLEKVSKDFNKWFEILEQVPDDSILYVSNEGCDNFVFHKVEKEYQLLSTNCKGYVVDKWPKYVYTEEVLYIICRYACEDIRLYTMEEG